MMLLSGIIIVFAAAFCGLTLAQGNTMDIQIENFNVEYIDNDLIGKANGERSEKNSESLVTFDFELLKDLSGDMKVIFDCDMDGTKLPPYETTISETLEDEIVGKEFYKALTPAVKNVPMKANKYLLSKWPTSKVNLPDTVPEGPFSGKIIVKRTDEKDCIIINFEGKLIRKLGNMG